ncbi:MAG: HAMP domain-containing histidine kinase, partial [Peptococcaceae bacterium]|nr:HAMP domain-containing histidine kinase [Peptococcaceae bacterium]
IVNCIHAGDHKNGCGASEACQHCSAVNLLLKSINDSKTSSGEIVITTKAKGFMLPMNLFETVTPFELNGEQFYIVALYDISDTKRRRTLERVFFHDILNTSGGLRGLISLLKEEIPSEYKPDLEFVEDTFSDLIDEVIAQRQLMEAENNELKIDFMTLRSDEVIDSIAKLYKNHEVAKNKAIIIEKNEKIIFKSDLVLLKRVLGNMVKNALEASGKGEKIVLGCRKRVSGGSKLLEFWVNNRQTMPKSTQLQVFNRSFSTKGSERGLGTYSMKLFGERYLKGEVSFESDDSSGTTFYLRLKC